MKAETEFKSADDAIFSTLAGDIIEELQERKIAHSRRKLEIRRRIEESLENRLIEKELDSFYDLRLRDYE